MKAKKAKKVGRKPAVLDTSMWGYYESTSDSDPYLTYESSMNDYVTEEEEEPTFNLDEINALGEGMCLYANTIISGEKRENILKKFSKIRPVFANKKAEYFELPKIFRVVVTGFGIKPLRFHFWNNQKISRGHNLFDFGL